MNESYYYEESKGKSTCYHAFGDFSNIPTQSQKVLWTGLFTVDNSPWGYFKTQL